MFQHRRSVLFSAAALLIGAMLLAVLLRPAAAAYPVGGNGKIAFPARTSSGKYDIFVMDSNSFNEVNLTNSAAFADFDPYWSPDGTKIAFTTDRDGNNEIYIMNADGTSPVNVSNDAGSDTSPAWSPDGLKLLFISNRDGNNEVWVMNADGTSPTQITNTAGTVSHKSPTWKPDGSKIGYSSNKDTIPGDARFDEIYLANPDGTGEVRLTTTPSGVTNPYYSRKPDWSPDGSKIVFFSRRTASNKDIVYTMLDNGMVEPAQTPVNISGASTRANAHARWSPDGTRIIFTSCRDDYGVSPNWNSCGDGGNHEIYVMNADGSNQTRLTHDLTRLDDAPSWQKVAPTVVGATCTTDCYVDPNGSDANDGASAATPLKSIQLALDTVWNNGTVHFAAGNYFENSPKGWVELELANKSVTLLGAGSGQSIVQLPVHKNDGLLIEGPNLDLHFEGLTFTHRAPGTLASGFNIHIGASGAANADVTFIDVESAYANGRNVILGANGTWDSVTVTDSNFHHAGFWGFSIAGQAKDVTVDNSHFDDNGTPTSTHGIGFDLEASGGTTNVRVNDSTFNNNKSSSPNTSKGINLVKTTDAIFDNVEATGNAAGIALIEWLGPLTSDIEILNSSLTANSVGIMVYTYNGTIDDLNIHDNDLTGNYRGVFLFSDSGGNITKTLITENDISGNTDAAVRVESGAGSIDDVNVHHNDMSGNAYGAYLVKGNGPITNLHVNRNDVSGNSSQGIRAMSFNPDADGQCNWWGAANGPATIGSGSGSNVSTLVDYTPWLYSDDLDGPCYVGGNITVTKAITGGGDPNTVFAFDPSWSATNFTLMGGQSETTAPPLQAGSYSVSEVTPLPTGWSLQSATCDNLTTTGTVETVNPAAITVADGDDWVCTFTNLYTPPPTNTCLAEFATSQWTDILGIGMGSPKKHKAQAKLAIPNYTNVVALYGQMVAKDPGNANYVRFIFPGKNNWVDVNAITSPLDHQYGNYWYGADLSAKMPAKQVTGKWFLQKSGTKNHIPRAFVLYPTYNDPAKTWVNVWDTFDASEGEVYWDTANGWTQQRVLTVPIAPPQGATTFNVKLALVDNDKDARPVWVTVAAGGVSQTVKPNNPDKGDQLNLLSFTLAGVPAGTDEITITVYSPSMAIDEVIGDSAALVGMTANYMCAPLLQPD